jgi:hypothetical protein
MEKTVAAIIGAIQAGTREHLQALGDYPKAEPFEHGIAVGTYRGLDLAIQIVEKVLNDEAEDDSRR